MPHSTETSRTRILVACTDAAQQRAVAALLDSAGLEVMAASDDDTAPPEWSEVDLIVTSADLVARYADIESPILALAESPQHASGAFEAGADALSLWPQEQAVLVKQVLCLLRSSRCAQQLKRLAYQDELTGLASRSYFLRHLDDLIRAAERDEKRFCLLYIDLDSFKEINDQLGHDVGDALLRIVAQRLVSTLRRSDLAARLGGDEFCILATGPAPNGAEVARRCLASAGEPLILAGHSIRPRLSIGIAYYPEDGTTASALLKAADRAMYEAKHHGGQRHVFYRPALTRSDREQRALEKRLRQAFERGDFTLHFQPQVDLQQGKTRGLEALLRWSDRRQLIRAAEFIGITERTGLIHLLGLWVIERACRYSAQWIADPENEPFILSINFSSTHLSDDNLVTRIESILADSNWPPDRLELEVQEEALQADQLNHLGQLKSLGIRLSVDDFGNGCAALANLSRWPVNTLKLDSSFVRGLDRDPHAAILTGTLVGLARSLEMELVAENVESKPAVQILTGLGCQTAQGHYFSPPLPPDAIPKILRRNWLNHTQDLSADQAEGDLG